MTETIGKVKLDYSKYPGEDLYCDGTVEDEILDIVKRLSPVEYAAAIEEKASWPVSLKREYCRLASHRKAGQGAGGRKRLRGSYRGFGENGGKRDLCGSLEKEKSD